MKFVLTVNPTRQNGSESIEFENAIILINLDAVKTICINTETKEALLTLNSGEGYLISKEETISLLAAISSNDIVRNPDMARVYKLVKS